MHPIAALFDDAKRHHHAGRLAAAEQLYQRILAIDPRHSDSLHLLGVAAYQLGRHEAADDLIGRAIQLRDDVPSYHGNLGNVLKEQGRIEEAIASYERALALDPALAETHCNLGSLLKHQGRLDEATLRYRQAAAIKPALAEAHFGLGSVFQIQGRLSEAVACYERARVLDPGYAQAHNNLGYAFHVQGKLDAAVACYRRALTLTPDDADAWNNLGYTLHAQGKLDDAVTCYERALALQPDFAEAHNNLGNVLKDLGSFDAAIARYERAISLRPDFADAYFNRADIKTFRAGDADLQALEDLAARIERLPAGKAPYVHFALAKALEDIGEHADAFEHLLQGNALKRREVGYDEGAMREFFRRLAAVFDSALLERYAAAGDPSPTPIFVIGMPRSGTTLLEQILSSHPQIQAAGELTDLDVAARQVFESDSPPVAYPECVATVDPLALRRIGQAYLARLPALAEGKIRITDKLPGNFNNVGLIRLVLPDARIIHAMRDPADTCVSCFSKLFSHGQEFTYELGELGRYYRYYRELMARWRSILPPGAMLEVRYEDVVEDLEGQARRMLDYCGLSWDERCLGFHRTPRSVGTASALQVRQPLYRDSIQRWRRYESFLAPLLAELQESH